ncbi:DUF932 domain-containing protein [Roseivirga sp. BDSF3-8]|uniref:DUF932 domain-containing protein n=1 Tax=Roseivirga sp. BDSF3-8 TaxID=3241598 RepID=UPI00353239E8
MAHKIHLNTLSGQHSFMSVKQMAWHGLGQVVDQYPTSSEAIKYAGLDYEVAKRPLFTLNTASAACEEGSSIPEVQVPGYQATVRTDTDQVLGIVGSKYEVVQNRDAFAFFDSIVEGEGILYETAGALGKGERIFITAKLPDYIRIGNSDDVITKYLLFTTSHDGSGSIMACFTPVRVVCNNTLNAAMRNKSNCISIRHTASAAGRLSEARTLLGLTNRFTSELDGLLNHWAKVRITDEQVKKLVRMALAPDNTAVRHIQQNNLEELSTVTKNRCDKAIEYAFSHPTQLLNTTKGTLYGAYNAVSGYYQNVANYKDDEARFTSITEGTGRNKLQRAFQLCQTFERFGTLELLNN